MSRKKGAVVVKAFDPADHLKSAEDVRVYLEEAIAESQDDAAFFNEALGVVARSHGMSKLAKETGISREGLYKALARSGNPTFGTVTGVLDALGLEFSLRTKAYAERVAEPSAPYAAFRKLDVGKGGHAKAPAGEAKRAIRKVIARKGRK